MILVALTVTPCILQSTNILKMKEQDKDAPNEDEVQEDDEDEVESGGSQAWLETGLHKEYDFISNDAIIQGYITISNMWLYALFFNWLCVWRRQYNCKMLSVWYA